jgi:hypothetical protein
MRGPPNAVEISGPGGPGAAAATSRPAPKYGFGRTELLPIKKTAEGVAKYVGKYVAKHIGQRLPADKGAGWCDIPEGPTGRGYVFPG